MIDFLLSRQWDIFTFLPPLMALAAYVMIDPVHSRLAEAKLREFLRTQGLKETYPLVNGISKDFSLQVVWISTVISFLASMTALAERQPKLVLYTIVIGILVGIPITLDIFLRPPGFHSTSKIGRTWIIRPLYRRGWTRFDAYSMLIAFSNVAFIVLLILTLPEK